ncbi:RNase adapter RapZ [Elioraea tepida]|uniref:RNase adapter RapZ n=1 Tax=Elioraea tepida TaxID=2843330 RepID=A0A975TZV9_9PROT|nr:RNase adapter RapZ [Elioraea tepida]QXM23690.1 RNase adapter RapZ [Elioraea tepida]
MTEELRRRTVALITGLSGAGRSSVLRVLEDLGWETIDTPPLAVIETLLAAADRTTPLAIGLDSRRGRLDAAAAAALVERARADEGLDLTVVFLTADEETLLRRYTETRRRHPMAEQGGVLEGVQRERALFAPLEAIADVVLDTSEMPLPDLRAQVEARFARPDDSTLWIGVVSFSFARGLPREADLVFDVRFLRNPYYQAQLKPLTGLHPSVADYVAGDPDFAAFYGRMTGLLFPLLPRYVREGKKYLTIAIGCTGGRHRSVMVADRLGSDLRERGWRVSVAHRDIRTAPDTARADGGTAAQVTNGP